MERLRLTALRDLSNRGEILDSTPPSINVAELMHQTRSGVQPPTWEIYFKKNIGPDISMIKRVTPDGQVSVVEKRGDELRTSRYDLADGMKYLGEGFLQVEPTQDYRPYTRDIHIQGLAQYGSPSTAPELANEYQSWMSQIAPEPRAAHLRAPQPPTRPIPEPVMPRHEIQVPDIFPSEGEAGTIFEDPEDDQPVVPTAAAPTPRASNRFMARYNARRNQQRVEQLASAARAGARTLGRASSEAARRAGAGIRTNFIDNDPDSSTRGMVSGLSTMLPHRGEMFDQRQPGDLIVSQPARSLGETARDVAAGIRRSGRFSADAAGTIYRGGKRVGSLGADATISLVAGGAVLGALGAKGIKKGAEVGRNVVGRVGARARHEFIDKDPDLEGQTFAPWWSSMLPHGGEMFGEPGVIRTPAQEPALRGEVSDQTTGLFGAIPVGGDPGVGMREATHVDPRNPASAKSDQGRAEPEGASVATATDRSPIIPGTVPFTQPEVGRNGNGLGSGLGATELVGRIPEAREAEPQLVVEKVTVFSKENYRIGEDTKRVFNLAARSTPRALRADSDDSPLSVGQDVVAVTPGGSGFVVMDGLHASRGGHVASDIAAKVGLEKLGEISVTDSTIAEAKDALFQALAEAHRKVKDTQAQSPDFSDMQTTAALGKIIMRGRDTHFVWASIGDSRISILRGKEVIRLNADDEQMIGRDPIYPQTGSYRLRKGDKLLMYTDGVYTRLTDEELRDEIYGRRLNRLSATVDRILHRSRAKAKPEDDDHDSTLLIASYS